MIDGGDQGHVASKGGEGVTLRQSLRGCHAAEDPSPD
jgi:hypothetical protein